MVEHHNYIGTINSGILLCDKVAIININALYIPKVTRKDGFKCCHKQMVTTWGDRQRNYFDLIITQCIPVLKWASINKSIMNQLKVQPHPPDTAYSNIYTVTICWLFLHVQVCLNQFVLVQSNQIFSSFIIKYWLSTQNMWDIFNNYCWASYQCLSYVCSKSKPFCPWGSINLPLFLWYPWFGTEIIQVWQWPEHGMTAVLVSFWS